MLVDLNDPVDKIGAALIPYAELSYRLEDAKETKWHPWSNVNASGLVADFDGQRIVVFTGSNDKADWRSNFDWSKYFLGQIENTIPATVGRDADLVETTAGFASYTALAYVGFRDCEKRMGLHPAENTIFVGHSLGAVPACLMPMFMEYRESVSVVYGSPRFLYRPNIPSRRRIHFSRIADYITYLPRRLKHPPMERRWIEYPGRLTGRLTTFQASYGRYIAFVATVRGAARQWLLGDKDAIWRGHSAQGYLEDFRGLGVGKENKS